MNARSFIGLICTMLILTASYASAGETDPGWDARSRVAAYALQIHDYTWTLPEEEGVILLYNRNYFMRTNGFRLIFDITPPYVVYGTVRGVPYSLSIYGNGYEMTYPRYRNLTMAERAEIANIYKYKNNGERISMKYGMSCATFLSDCLRQGFRADAPPVITGVITLMSDLRWKKFFVFGKRGWRDYENLETADFLCSDDHVMLVIDNDPEQQRLQIVEQTPPDYAVSNCENMTDVTVTLYYRGKPTQMQAKRLCMECEACLRATTGTQLRWADYQELGDLNYRAVFVKYPEA